MSESLQASIINVGGSEVHVVLALGEHGFGCEVAAAVIRRALKYGAA
jgi:hypothetical protein